MKTLPKEVYVTLDPNADGSVDLLAWRDIAGGIDGDGPTTIGVYQLVKTIKRKKIVAEA